MTANQKQTAGHGLYDTLNDSLSDWLFPTTNVDFSVKTSAYDLRLTTTSFATNVEWASDPRLFSLKMWTIFLLQCVQPKLKKTNITYIQNIGELV